LRTSDSSCGTAHLGEIEWTEERRRTRAVVNSIYLALRFLRPAVAHAWIREPNDNELFEGKPPLELMLSGEVGLDDVVRDILRDNGGPL
jgi:hypothetical protein